MNHIAKSKSKQNDDDDDNDAVAPVTGPFRLIVMFSFLDEYTNHNFVGAGVLFAIFKHPIESKLFFNSTKNETKIYKRYYFVNFIQKKILILFYWFQCPNQRVN